MQYTQSLQLKSTRNFLARSGIQINTRDSYKTHFENWKCFCEWYEIDYTELSVGTALDFLAWAYKWTSLNSAQADKTLTSVVSFLKDVGSTFDRKSFPTIRRHLDGFRKHRPPKMRKKMPFCQEFIDLAFEYCIDLHDFDDVVCGIALCLGHDGGLRPGEYTFAKKSIEKLLRLDQVECLPNWSPEETTEMTIKILSSKMNKQNKKNEMIILHCKCIALGFEINEKPCAVHLTQRHIQQRIKKFGKHSIDRRQPLLLNSKGKHFRYDHIRNFMWNFIMILNQKKRINLNPKHYTPHTLRMGGCTDKARQGEPGWKIELWGRWASKIWKTTYINMDWTDLSKITNRTLTDLKKDVKIQPYS